MKTAILKVEIYDDAASIRDKIAWCKSERILLVIPKQKRTFPARVELEIIERCANENGAQLAIVTRNSITREFADSLGIRVFPSVADAERGDWGNRELNQREVKPFKGKDVILEMRDEVPDTTSDRSFNQVIKLSLLVILCFMVLYVVVFALPSATVILYPESETLQLALDLRATTQVDQINITGSIPAERQTIMLTEQKTGLSTGTVPVGKDKATGEVSLKNLTQDTVNLPTGTVFSTSSEEAIRFIAGDEVQIPPGEESVKLSVEAILPGEEGNVQAGQITIIEGIYGSQLEVANEEPFTGGTSPYLPAPTADDYNVLRSELLAELEEQALTSSEPDASGGLIPIQESLKLEEVTREEQANPPGVASDTLTLTLTARYGVLYYDPVQVTELAKKVLDIAKPKQYHTLGTNIFITSIGEVTMIDSSEADWTVNIAQQIIKDYPSESLKKMIKGKRITEAVRILNEEVPHSRSAEVIPFIKWWPNLPFVIDQIQIEEKVEDGG